MAKAGPFNVTFPEFKLPELKLPKFDLDALFALQTANLAAAHEVQSIVLEASQAIAKVQHGWLEESAVAAKAALSAKEPKPADAILADVKVAAEKAVAAGKQGVDLGVAAQQKVADLVAKRVQANIEELKALAA
jgi:hypothetical protein